MCTQGNLRAQVAIGFVVPVLGVDPIQKRKVVIAMTTSAVMGHERVVLVMEISAVYPGVVMVVVNLLLVVIAKIILAAVVPKKEMDEKVCTCVNAVIRAVAIRVMKVSIVSKGDWGEDCTSFFKFIIPIATSIDAPARSPDITRWNPDPVFFTRVPVA